MFPNSITTLGAHHDTETFDAPLSSPGPSSSPTPNDHVAALNPKVCHIISIHDTTGELPAELLYSIFELACVNIRDMDFSAHKRKPMDTLRQMRASITGTCSRWRDVALASPRV
ncbi:hypothetical protein DL93DRAFT_1052192 [Clavulina sp. PMI_390]|nr:hypothetical protein DL93DRAFT_1052192 [Clavulina sp. PMI_390]